MKQLVLFGLTIFITAQAVAQKFQFNYNTDFQNILTRTIDANDNLSYFTLLKRFKANDPALTNFEVLALLIGFTGNTHFKPYSYLQTERKIQMLNSGGNFKAALGLSDSLLQVVPVSPQALFEKSYAHFMLDEKDSSQYFMWKFQKIMETMALTGDGLSAETDIFSLGPADGQIYIRGFLLGDIGIMGSGRDKHGNFMDILTAITKDQSTGQTKSETMYFQIEHAVKSMHDKPGSDKRRMKGHKRKKERAKLEIEDNGPVIKN